MKKYVLAFVCAALAGLAWAEVVPPTLSPVVTAPAASPATVAVPPDAYAPVCGAPCCTAKVCLPVPGTRKKDVVLYDDKCVDYCLPHCSLTSLFWGCGCGCGEGGCPSCGCPRVKHVLIKNIVHEECPETKCEVQEVPRCGSEAPCGPPLLFPGK